MIPELSGVFLKVFHVFICLFIFVIPVRD